MNNSEVIEDLKSIIKEKGMKYTEQRAVILNILLNSNEHLHADEVNAIIKKDYPNYNIGIATVYRTLKFLEEVKLISSISVGTEGKRYESNSKNQHHDHLICTNCNKIVEFIDDNIEEQQEKIAKQNDFIITNHIMQIYGLCKKCQQKIK